MTAEVALVHSHGSPPWLGRSHGSTAVHSSEEKKTKDGITDRKSLAARSTQFLRSRKGQQEETISREERVTSRSLTEGEEEEEEEGRIVDHAEETKDKRKTV